MSLSKFNFLRGHSLQLGTDAVSTWTTRTCPVMGSNTGGTALIWVPELGLFVGGTGGTSNQNIHTSPDGITWTIRTTLGIGTAGGFESLCWSPELRLIVAMGRSTTNVMYNTSNDGVSWTNGTTNFWGGSAKVGSAKVCWSPELGLFCSVINETTETNQNIATSPDAVTWTIRTNPATTSLMSDVAWIAELGIFAAVGRANGSLQYVMTSPDGVTWTSRQQTGTGSNVSIAWAPELGYAIITATGSTTGWKTTDFTSFTSVAIQNTGSNVTRWISGLGMFIYLSTAATATTNLYTSPDGITWTARTTAAFAGFHAQAYSDKLGVLVISLNNTGSAAYSANT